MSISVFDLFKIGIGPSSSHTVGPMNAARLFVKALEDTGQIVQCGRVTAELFGSLGATGAGHGSPKAIILGLSGESPETVNIDSIPALVEQARAEGKLLLQGHHEVVFNYRDDLIMHRTETLPFHPNGMRFSAFSKTGEILESRVYFSVGGGFIVDETADRTDIIVDDPTPTPYPFTTADQLLALCSEHGLSIPALMMRNECAWRTETEIRKELLHLWKVMDACIAQGCNTEGVMPGGLISFVGRFVTRCEVQRYMCPSARRTKRTCVGSEGSEGSEGLALLAIPQGRGTRVRGRRRGESAVGEPRGVCCIWVAFCVALCMTRGEGAAVV